MSKSDHFWQVPNPENRDLSESCCWLVQGFRFFTMPWMVSCALALCWILVMVWPEDR